MTKPRRLNLLLALAMVSSQAWANASPPAEELPPEIQSALNYKPPIDEDQLADY
jgi:hypothetical protein